jgi:hypothetical protein
MGKVEQLAKVYRHHIESPWQRTVAGAQRVIMIVYEKELERTVLARRGEFERETREAGHAWLEVDVSNAFAEWLAGEDYCDAYFDSPEDLQLKLDAEFTRFVAGRISEALAQPEAAENGVVAVSGVGALFGFTRISQVLKLLEPDIKGRLVVFFPGTYDKNNYRLLDARDGWNYLAVPITLHSSGGY